VFRSQYLLFQASKSVQGTSVDAECLKMTVSYMRKKHEQDDTVAICDFYEVSGLEVTSTNVILVMNKCDWNDGFPRYPKLIVSSIVDEMLCQLFLCYSFNSRMT